MTGKNGGRHLCGLTALLYLPKSQGARSVEMEYRALKIKMAVKLYGSDDPAMKMVREFDG